ncbi:MAG: hypothetical protein IJ111_02150 [Eggerthellaceae bacterium]|nr:hypothetical protein [Eggerthellaceae bacterium]
MAVKVERPSMDLKKERELEVVTAELEKFTATLEYVAMMADVELEEDEDEQLRS